MFGTVFVVREVSAGSSISEVCRRYGIKGGETVQVWIRSSDGTSC
jgi:transposase-like protein